MKWADLHWGMTVYTAPTLEPVTVAEAQAQCRIDANDEYDLLESMIVAAREATEALTGRAWINQTRDLTMDGFPEDSESIDVPCAPLASVTSITYVDTVGATQTWSSTLYDVDTVTGRIAPKFGQSYPATRGQQNAVVVRFVCGYGTTATGVPARAKQAMKLHIAQAWMNRGGSKDESQETTDRAIRSLLGPLMLPGMA